MQGCRPKESRIPFLICSSFVSECLSSMPIRKVKVNGQAKSKAEDSSRNDCICLGYAILTAGSLC